MTADVPTAVARDRLETIAHSEPLQFETEAARSPERLPWKTVDSTPGRVVAIGTQPGDSVIDPSGRLTEAAGLVGALVSQPSLETALERYQQRPREADEVP